VAKVYLEIAGADRIDEVKAAYNNWRENKFRGPSSINIFISLLSKNLEGPQQSDFEARAQDCIHL
jgi:hypothetical protein